jgi:G3E family GTPase
MPKISLPDASKQRVPVTIITVFLGSGKSTLLNHILRWSQSEGRSPERGSGGGASNSSSTLAGLNIAVIENEFGEISIDKTIGTYWRFVSAGLDTF